MAAFATFRLFSVRISLKDAVDLNARRPSATFAAAWSE